jgi:hypothetical protein
MKTMAEARRERGISESEYINTALDRDSVNRIATIRTLVRWFGPPDNRYEHIEGIRLDWSPYAPQGKRSVFIRPDGSISG